MAWVHVIAALGAALGAGAVTVLARRETERQEEWRNRREKRWEARMQEARNAQVLADKRAYDEGQKEKALIEKYASARSYWKTKIGDGEFYLFMPTGVPGDDPITAEVLEVLDKGLRVEDESGVHHFISFEGTTFAVPEEEESEEESPPAPPAP